MSRAATGRCACSGNGSDWRPCLAHFDALSDPDRRRVKIRYGLAGGGALFDLRERSER
ncbi:hypothetical protein ACIRPU_02105 [Streptomyces sp. NPDC102259]|uniref:hypothetical protein n=1 Tax=Streptomyces sp. NPDC102259 TaxID=3366148 RepID=UPI0038096A19